MKIRLPVDHHIHRKLKEAGIEHDTRVSHVTVDADSYAHFLKRISTDYTHLSSEEQHALAISTCLTHPDHKHKQSPPKIPIQHWLILVIALAVVLAFSTLARCQESGLDRINFRDSSGNLTRAFTGPFNIKEGTGVTFSATATTLTINTAGAGGTFYQTFQSAAVSLTQRNTANFLGAIACVDNAGSTRTDCGLALNNAVASQFLTGIDASGNFLRAQPAYSGITGTPQLAQTKAAVASNWIRSYDAATGLFTASQPAYSDISGTPTLAATLANVAHKWLNSYNSATGLFTQTQPDYTDLTGTPAVPTGTGFSHITGGALDGASKTVDVSSADITGVLKAAAFPAITGDGTTPGGSLAFTLATVATPGTGLKTTVNAKGLVTAVATAASTDLSDTANLARITTSNTYSVSTTQDMDTARAKYWGGAPIFDAFEYAGTDMCDKIAAVQADAAFTAVASSRIKVDGFTGDQNCATSNPFASTHSTKWGPFNPGLHVHLTRSAFTFGPATSSLIAAPAAPTLATATTGGSLAAATTYGVKVTLVNLSGETTPSAEATKLTGAGATNSITVTSPTVAFPAYTGAVAYNTYSATPVGSGWKLNNTSGPIALGTSYVIKTVGAGVIPPVTNLAANDQYEVDFGNSTWSIESNTALILAAVNNTYFHDLTLVNSTTLDNGVANAYVNSNISHVVFERITGAGGRIGFAINNGDTDIRFSNLRWGNPTVGTGGQVGIYVTSGGGTTPSNIVVDGFELLPSVLNTTAFISAGILTNPCNDCTIQRVRCTNVDMSLSAFGGCVEIGGNNTPTGGSTNIHVMNVFCDTLIWMDCVAVNSFSSNVTIDDVTFKNSNTVAGINGLTTFQQGDCLDIFMASNINVTNVLCQNLNTLSHTLPSVEIFDTQEVSLTNVKALDSAAGLKLFGAPSTHLNGVGTSRNFNTGYLIIDYNALVTCNGTTAVVFVSGPGGFGPWVAGTQITINGVTHQIASVTDGTHLVTQANCAVGASVTMLMPTTDVSIVNPKADDNGMNATGTGARTGTSEGIFVSGGSQISVFGGSGNDSKATANKTQQYGLRVTGTARARVVGFDASNNVGAVTAPCTGTEYGANVAGNHWICDDVKNSAVWLDDGVSGKWTLATSTANGASLAYTAGVNPTTPISGDTWFDGTNYFVRAGTTSFTVEKVVTSGTSTFTTTAVGAAGCQTVVTTAATNAATTDIIAWSFNSAPVAATDASLITSSWPTAGNVNFKRCNPTSASITPTALVANWQVLRR